MKVFENKEFSTSEFDARSFDAQELESGAQPHLARFEEPAPSDVTYNFGASTAAGFGAKAATYLASALALGGSLFVSNQLMIAPNLQRADTANAASQTQDSNAAAADQDNSASGTNTGADGSAPSFSDDGTNLAGAASGGTDAGSSSGVGVTSLGGRRLASKTSNVSAPAPSSTPAPSATQDATVIVPPPTLPHANTSNSTQVASSGTNGGSNFGGDEGDDEQEYEGEDD